MGLYSKKNQRKPREAYQNNGMSTVPYAMQAIKPSATIPYAKQAIKPSATASYANQFDLPAKTGKNNEKMFYTEPENSGIIGKKTIGDYDTEIAGFDNKIAKLMKQQYNHMLGGETDKMKAITPWIKALEDKRDTVKLGKAGALGIGKWDSKSLLGQVKGTLIRSTPAAKSRADVSLSGGEDLSKLNSDDGELLDQLQQELKMRRTFVDNYSTLMDASPYGPNHDLYQCGLNRNLEKISEIEKEISTIGESEFEFQMTKLKDQLKIAQQFVNGYAVQLDTYRGVLDDYSVRMFEGALDGFNRNTDKVDVLKKRIKALNINREVFIEAGILGGKIYYLDEDELNTVKSNTESAVRLLLQKNAKISKEEIGHNIFAFSDKVRSGQPWDYKLPDNRENNQLLAPIASKEYVYYNGYVMDWEQFGNFHYGYTGAAAGYDILKLKLGSLTAAKFNLDENEKVDQCWIYLGYMAYENDKNEGKLDF